MQKTLVIVSGVSGSGKTTLARHLSDRFGLVMVQKDGLKETLFDALGWSDREWSKKLGLASYSLMDHFMSSLLSAGVSFLVESNFKPQFDAERFKKICADHGYEPVQIYVHCDPVVAYARFLTRVDSGERHPGHVDGENREEMKKMIDGWATQHGVMEIGGSVVEVDTTDFAKIDYDKIYAALSPAMAPAA